CFAIYFFLQIFNLFSAFTFNNFYFTTGQRSSIKLVYAGYHFVKYMENSRGTKWICATRSSTKCRARVRTTKESKLEVLRPDHNHDLIKQRIKKPKVKLDDVNISCSLIDNKQNLE
ncbi:uncharacterized protein pre-mod(mdg4)-U, partial [Calliphora vicina]|uniref:uncharacterized protein pre-mod(mdg4)-U n=1 Tax=Calliphora vicina TaxID=7373 RepID=UPI00325BC701